jgi:hypothetical protein
MGAQMVFLINDSEKKFRRDRETEREQVQGRVRNISNTSIADKVGLRIIKKIRVR